MTTEGFRLTPMERIAGRIMRAPDHGDDDGGAPLDGTDGGADTDKGTDTGTDGGADDKGATDTGTQTDGDAGQTDDGETSLAGGAKPATDADDGAGGDDKDGDADKGGDAAPDTYDLKLTVKQGEGDDAKDVEVPIDPTLVEAATPVFKDVGLTNEQANKLLPLVPQVQQRAIEDFVKGQGDTFAELRKTWHGEVMKDPELGGKNWPVTEQHIAKALDHYGAKSEIKEVDGKKVETNEFRKLLNESGIGNHPAFVRVMANIGKAVGEDTNFPRGDAKAEKLPAEAILYPEDYKA